MNDFTWENLHHPRLTELRETYHLLKVPATGKTEFEKQQLLKTWVHHTLPLGTPRKDYSKLSAFEILADAKQGAKFWCTEYAFTFLQCALALGWQARKLGVDFEHGQNTKDQHHGVADIWSRTFHKWYVVDAQHNLHFEKQGIPLNALEIRTELLKNQAADITGVIGLQEKTIHFSPNTQGYDTPNNYFWFFISQRNNFFSVPGLFNTQTLLWEDTHNANNIWYKTTNEKSIPHPMYEHQFIKTSNKDTLFPVLL